LHRNTNKDCFYREENFKAIINSALVGFYLVNREGQVLDANDAYCSIVGYSHEELLNMEIKDIEDVESGETVGERIQRIAEKGSERFEAKHKRKDGNFVFIEASVHYLKDEQAMLSVFIRDIVERKQVETELGLADKELLFQNAEKEKRAAESVKNGMGAVIHAD
jgi:PAS domain S-box-containing protein